MVTRWNLLFLGIWILLSPWLLGFSGIAIAKWSNVLVGLAIALVNAWTIFGNEPVPVEPEPKIEKPISTRNGRRSRANNHSKNHSPEQ